MDKETLDFLWSKIVPCNTTEEMQGCQNDHSEEYKKLMDYIHQVVLESQEKE